MKRRSFLKGILAAVCAPLVVLKALAAGPKPRVYKIDKYEIASKQRMPATRGLKPWTFTKGKDTDRINPSINPVNKRYVSKDGRFGSIMIEDPNFGEWEFLETIPIKKDDDMYKDLFSPRIKRTERRINPFLPADYVKTSKKLGY